MEDMRVPCNSIVRIWRGRVPREKADSYSRFLRDRAIPDYRGTPGNLGVLILRRDLEEETVFTIITFWTGLDAIKAFAGEDYERAKYYPEDSGYLLEFPEKVEHYTIDSCGQ